LIADFYKALLEGMRSSGDFTSRRKFRLCRSRSPTRDPIADFVSGGIAEGIKAGDGIAVTEDPHRNLIISLNPIPQQKTTYAYPSQLTLNKFGQITSVVEGVAPLAPFYIVPNYSDVVINSPNSLSAAGTKKNAWSGRWRTNDSRIGPLKLSFVVSSSRSIVGLAHTADITGKEYIKAFSAAFYFESPTAFGVLDNAHCHKGSGIQPIGKWTQNDTFSILFNGKHFIYYQNGKKIYTQKSGSVAPLYAAGLFYNVEGMKQTVTHLSIQEVLSVADDVETVQSIMKCANGVPMLLNENLLTLVNLTMNTRFDGNISVWGNVDTTGPAFLSLSIKSENRETHVDLTSDKAGLVTLFLGTPTHFPPDLYTITLYAKAVGSVDVNSSRIMAMGHLL